MLYLAVSWRSHLSMPLCSVYTTCVQVLVSHLNPCEVFKYFYLKHICLVLHYNHTNNFGFTHLQLWFCCSDTVWETRSAWNCSFLPAPSGEKRRGSVLPHFLHLAFAFCVMSIEVRPLKTVFQSSLKEATAHFSLLSEERFAASGWPGRSGVGCIASCCLWRILVE